MNRLVRCRSGLLNSTAAGPFSTMTPASRNTTSFAILEASRRSCVAIPWSCLRWRAAEYLDHLLASSDRGPKSARRIAALSAKARGPGQSPRAAADRPTALPGQASALAAIPPFPAAQAPGRAPVPLPPEDRDQASMTSRSRSGAGKAGILEDHAGLATQGGRPPWPILFTAAFERRVIMCTAPDVGISSRLMQRTGCFCRFLRVRSGRYAAFLEATADPLQHEIVAKALLDIGEADHDRASSNPPSGGAASRAAPGEPTAANSRRGR